MSTAEPPPPSPQYRIETRRRPIWALLLMSILPAAVIGGVLWYALVIKPKQESQQFTHDVMLRTSGLARHTSNQLDERFSDADKDLVADPPTDPKDHIDPPTLVFTYIPIPADDDDPHLYSKAFAEFVQHLSKVTGKPAEYREFNSPDEQLKAMRDGQLHVSGYNTGSVPIAVDLAGFVPVCKLATADGTGLYRMQVIVPADSTIQSVQDLDGKELTVTEPGSNSGYKAPLVLLHNSGLDPERDYILRFSMSHDNSIKGIADKSYQAAAVAGDVLLRAIARGQISTAQFRKIYESEAFPTACFGYVYNLKPELAAKVREAFFSFDWKGTGLEREFASSEQSKFVPANFKDDWALIRQIDEAIGVEYKID
jgi:phosphonate transport system substrate-binding protein